MCACVVIVIITQADDRSNNVLSVAGGLDLQG